MNRSETILLIDDDVFLCNAYKTKFERVGFNVVVQNNAQHALQMMRDGLHPDLILLDLIMPGMDGFAFLGQAKSEGLPLPPIIILTNQEGAQQKEEAFALGANNYVVKASATPSEILKQIIEILRTQEELSGTADNK